MDNKKKDIAVKQNTDKKTLRRKRVVAAISTIIAVAFMLWLGYICTETILSSLESEEGVAAAARNFNEMIKSYGNWGVVVAFGIQVLQVVVSPIPGEVIEVGMGVCFGWFGGALICLLGGALAASIIMLFVKKFGVKIVELFVSTDKINELRFINNEKKLERTVFLLYLIPGTPKDPLIFFFGLTRIKIKDFVIISTLARIPSVVTSTIAGKYAVDENYLVTFIILIVTALIALLGMFFYHKILKIKQKHQAEKDSPKD